MADRIMNETTSPEQAARIASLEADNARLRAIIDDADAVLLHAYGVANLTASAMLDAAASGERGLEIGAEETGVVLDTIVTMIGDARKRLDCSPA